MELLLAYSIQLNIQRRSQNAKFLSSHELPVVILSLGSNSARINHVK